MIGSRIEWEEVRKRSREERSMQRKNGWLNEADSFNENSGTSGGELDPEICRQNAPPGKLPC